MSFKDKAREWLDEQSSDTINTFFQSEFTVDISKWDSEEEINDKKAAQLFFSDNGIEFNHEDNFGGEGQGEDYWSVYSFKDKSTGETLYVKFDGWYQSYNGSEFDEWYFVKPKQVQVTQYEKV
jgi:hypothetical protein